VTGRTGKFCVLGILLQQDGAEAMQIASHIGITGRGTTAARCACLSLLWKPLSMLMLCSAGKRARVSSIRIWSIWRSAWAIQPSSGSRRAAGNRQPIKSLARVSAARSRTRSAYSR